MSVRVAAGVLLLNAACGGTPSSGLGDGTTGSTGTTDTTASQTGSTTDAADASSSTDATTAGASSSSSASTSGGPQICGADGTPSLRIGHGYKLFMPLESGPAELIHGPQGGVHITLGLRSPGIDVSEFADVHLHGEVNGRVVADHVQGAILNCNADFDVAEAIWLSMIFDVGSETLHEQTITMDLTLTDGVGTMISGQADVMIWDPVAGGTDSGSSSDGASSSSGTTGL